MKYDVPMTGSYGRWIKSLSPSDLIALVEQGIAEGIIKATPESPESYLDAAMSYVRKLRWNETLRKRREAKSADNDFWTKAQLNAGIDPTKQEPEEHKLIRQAVKPNCHIGAMTLEYYRKCDRDMYNKCIYFRENNTFMD